MNLSRKPSVSLLIEHLRPQKRRVILLTVLLFGDIGLQLVSPQIIRRFIDTVQTGTLETLMYIAAFYIGVVLAQQAVSVWSTYVGENVSWIATNRLRGRLAHHCLHLDMSFHNNRTPGEMIERVDGDINALGNFFSQFVIQMLGNVLLMAGVLILLFVEDWRAGIGLSIFAVVSMGVVLGLRKIAIPHIKANREASTEMFGFLEERLSGAEDIRSCRAVPYTLRRFYELTRNWLQKEIKSGYMINILITSSVIIWAIGNAAALGIGAYLYWETVFSIGAVYMLFHYANMLIQPIERIIYQFEDFQRAGASVERVTELMNIQPALTPGRGDALPDGTFPVAFHNVTFGYVENDPILHNIDFTLQPGRVLGLLGRTGSGKTTLTRLLFRLYDPWTGSVCLGETNVRHANRSDLRNRIAMVTQNVQLFQASVRDNLTLFDPNIDDERIKQAVENLGLSDWLHALPNALDTELSAEGGGLSAGEAQLLAFARVFLLKSPDLVILDEASSRLDPATEHHLEHAVDQLIGNRTAIVIAHRLGTVRRADDIMILDEGRIVEYGPRKALERDETSRFSNLLRTGMEDVLV